MPVAVKDVIDVAGDANDGGLAHPRATTSRRRDAIVVARLRSAGAIVVGKLNTHEFAFGASTTSPHFGPARNPWDTERICGGSSGGSGAAVAAGLVAGTLGTDTAGSIRIPACFCGVTGLRPSTGRVPNRGVVPVSWTFDTVGPIAPERRGLRAAARRDRRARRPTTRARSAAPAEPASSGLERGVAGLRIGVVAHLSRGAVDPRVVAAVEAALGELAASGPMSSASTPASCVETEVDPAAA